MSEAIRNYARGGGAAAGRLFGAALAVMLAATGSAAGKDEARFETAAPVAILVDHESGRVLFEKNAGRKVAPASLAKLMTVAVAFDALKTGQVALDDTFAVSERAWREGGAKTKGSTMFLEAGAKARFGDLLEGAIVVSGNDATIVLAEGLGGSVGGFAKMMNAKAKEIGLKDSRFATPHGLTHPDQVVTMRDMAMLARHLIEAHPDLYPLFAQRRFTYNGITQDNRNPLLDPAIGADGLKTGHTRQAGYALVGSAEREGRRLVLAMSGMTSQAQRAQEARRLLEWGFARFAGD